MSQSRSCLALSLHVTVFGIYFILALNMQELLARFLPGSRVTLRDTYGGTYDGPLKAGDIGIITRDSGPGKPYTVCCLCTPSPVSISTEHQYEAEALTEFKPEPPEEGRNVSVANFAAGLLVKRGPDWKYDDQDGGEGGLGRLVALDTDYYGRCSVRWDESGDSNWYRIGRKGKHELVFGPILQLDATLTSLSRTPRSVRRLSGLPVFITLFSLRLPCLPLCIVRACSSPSHNHTDHRFPTWAATGLSGCQAYFWIYLAPLPALFIAILYI